MTITVQAIYEDGVLKPAQPLPFGEHERVTVTIGASVASTAGRANSTSGLVKWNGNPDELERFAIDPAFDPQENHPGRSLAQEMYGIIKWTGTHEEFQQILDESEENFYL